MCAAIKSSDANEEAGMSCLTMEDWKHARSVVGPSITRGVTMEIPKVSWEDIGGLKDLKKKLQKAVEWPLKHSAAFSRLGVSPVRGILLHGPPGCSKTTLAKATAHAAQASFFSLRFDHFLFASIVLRFASIYLDLTLTRLNLHRSAAAEARLARFDLSGFRFGLAEEESVSA
ncbi:cell division cycle 48B [Actinidia rufa]|uniref:Cell division cycle 48B n=1 Tax=Actinidia rufa TaxID=165716 RepID=A0A7J0GJJ8_9ERIC|nr:cell division cycle 48B [Actinidia rufa]